CPDSEAGMIVMELGAAVADLTVTDYVTMEVVATLFQETGTVEIPMVPGEYAIMMDAQEGTTLCRSGRRQVLIAPGEQPELLGVEPIPSECNEGVASLAFELYGSGDYQTDLMQGNTSVWSETLPAGEHVLEGIAPGNYVLKVDHVCLETYEFVSLLDEESTEIDVQYSGFVLAEAHGGAWLEAACPICETGEGYGYTWLLNGEPVESDAPLAVRVETVGTYALELVTYGFECEARQAFDITVGKYLQSNAVDLEWMGVHDGQLGVRFPEEWAGVEYSWYDATGRLVDAGGISTAVGEVFIGAPDARGWMTLEVRAKDGRTAHWAGIL
ncbi:MAG: hypothetical protein L7S67_06940, partial [Flavobacteriales bacterium]|nr:hypothetical protein [Flavobacteriales bacterium]